MSPSKFSWFSRVLILPVTFSSALSAQIINDASLVVHFDASDLNADGLSEKTPAPYQINSWSDKSTYARHATRQGTNGNVALYPQAFNGMPAVHFGNQVGNNPTNPVAGTIDWMTTTALSSEQIAGPGRNEVTTFVVARRHAGVVYFQWDNSITNRHGFEGGTRWDMVDTNNTPTGGQLNSIFQNRGETYLLGVTRGAADSNTMRMFYNGSPDVSTRSVNIAFTAGVTDPISLGAQDGGTNPCQVDLAEVLHYNRALSPAERVQIETYLRKKYFLDQASVSNGVYINRGSNLVRSLRSAVSSNPVNTGTTENVDRLFDGVFLSTATTKLLMTGAVSPANPFFVNIQFAGDQAATVSQYTIVSANDDPTRDPKDWTIEGSNDGSAWTVVDTQTAQTWGGVRHLAKNFSVATPGSYNRYRMRITANNGSTTLVQLAELILNSGNTVTSTPTSNNVNECAPMAFDGRSDTKFLAANVTTFTLTNQLPASQVIRGYAITTANDAPLRDPRNWTLEGSNNGTTWTTLDTRTNEPWQTRYQVREFNIPNSTAYTHYRLNVSHNWGDAQSQIAELALLSYTATTDSDGDGCPDAREFQNDPSLATVGTGDTDSDGLTDAFELAHFGSTTAGLPGADPDGDGLTNLQEAAFGSNPVVKDSDNDGLNDGAEFAAGTNPNNPDSDGDTLADGAEAAHGANPALADTDGDGVNDGVEVAAGFNPNLSTTNPAFFNGFAVNFAEAGQLDLMPPTDFVGATGYPQRFWNNFPRLPLTPSPATVVDQTGAAIGGLSLSWTSTGTGSVSNNSVTTYNTSNYNTPVKRLFNGFLNDTTDADNAVVTITGVPYARYHLIVYADSSDANAITGSYRVLDGSNAEIRAKRYLTSTTGVDTTIRLSDGGTAAAGAPLGNALIFRDLNLATLKLVARRESTPTATRAPLAGFQIVAYDPTADSDSDGLTDEAEILAFQSLQNDGTADPDNDGLTNAQEVAAGTSFTNPDTDGDGILDGADAAPALADADNDGLNDAQELALGTNPAVADTDGDGVNDGVEEALGTNPNLLASVPGTDLLYAESFSSYRFGAGRFDTQAASILHNPRSFTVANATAAASIAETNLAYGDLVVTGQSLRTPPGPAGTNSESFTTLDLGVTSRLNGTGLVNGGYVGNGTASGTIYVSFLAKSHRLSRDNTAVINTTNAFFGLQLYRDTIEVLGVGEPWGPRNHGIFGTGGEVAFTPAVPVTNATRLFVAKITFNNGVNDDITVWIDPDLTQPEGSQTGSSVVHNARGNLAFNRLAFRSGSDNNDGAVSFDEVRMASTWGAVLPRAVSPATSGLVIGEFSASNSGNARDEDGDTEDWIEILNGTGSPVTLDGLYLSDSAALPAKWQFPDTTPDRVLAPGQSIVVWASDKDPVKRPGYTATSQLHTNFKLSTNGAAPLDSLLIVAADGTTVLSQITDYPVQSNVSTYGLKPDGSGNAYLVPTPGTPNAQALAGFPAPLALSPGSSVRTGPTSVTISGQQVGQTVRYTLDGSIPSLSNGTIYTGPFTVSTTAQLRARVCSAGLTGPISTSILLFPETTVQPDVQADYNLPVLVIDTHGRTIPADGTDATNEYPAECSYALYDKLLAEPGVSLRDTVPSFLSRGRISVRGKSTSVEPKRPFNIEFWRDDIDDDLSRPVLGLASDSDWVLNNIYGYDRGGLRNATIYDLSNLMKQWAPGSRFVEVYLNQDGGNLVSADYYGLYVLMEKPNRGADRVDVESLESDDNTSPNVTGGYIFQLNKTYTTPATDYRVGLSFGVGTSSVATGSYNFALTGAATGNATSDFLLEYPEEDRVTTAQASYLSTFINDFEDTLAPAATNWTNPTTGKTLTEYIDLDSWVDHHLLNTLAKNVDGLRLSHRFYKPRGTALVDSPVFSGPVWDFDRSINSVDGRDNDPLTWDSLVGSDGTNFFQYGWFARLALNPDFMQRWVDRYTDHRRTGGPLDLTVFNAIVDGHAAKGAPVGQTRSPLVRNQARWPGSAVTGGEMSQESALVKNWIAQRVGFIDTQMLTTPAFSPAESVLGPADTITLSSPSLVGGAILYYTVNGSDPRLPGGGISPSAIAYSGPFTVGASTLVRARVYDSSVAAFNPDATNTKMTQWSALSEGYYLREAAYAAATNLVISEFMYNPAPLTPAEITAGFTDADQFEYIELLNVGSTVVNIRDARFSAGVEYRFSNATITELNPGERVYLVANLDAFTSRHPSAASRVAGTWGAENLSNAGETITLRDHTDAVLITYTYDDLAPWPVAADGTGPSLVLTSPQPSRDHSLAANWRASTGLNGDTEGTESESIQLYLNSNGFSDPLADPDGDGFSHLLTYAFGLDIGGASARPVSAFQNVPAAGGNRLTIAVTQRLAAEDVAFHFDYQTQLGGAWDLDSIKIVLLSTTPLGNGLVRKTYYVDENVTIPGKHFIRARVETP